MEKIASSALKTILLSKRANIYYLEKCRVMQKDGRIVYLTEGKKENLYWNIPIANTTTLLLGTGTSITQAAVRDLAGAGVMIGFCGGGGTPLLAGTGSRFTGLWLLFERSRWDRRLVSLAHQGGPQRVPAFEY